MDSADLYDDDRRDRHHEELEHLRGRPSDNALEAASIANEWARGEPLRLRHCLFDLQPWVAEDSPDEIEVDLMEGSSNQDAPKAPEPPPLTRLLQETGGIDAIRPKLLLSLLWIVTNQVEQVIAEPFEFWAHLLDLEDPENKGARRIRESIARLGAAERGDPCSFLLRLEPRPPQPPRVGVLHECGTGRPWTQPSPGTRGPKDYFLELPPTFWTNGWLSILSGSALMAYLIVRSAEPFRAPRGSAVWISQERLEDHHRINPKTWQAGIRELADLGLVSTRKTSISTSTRFTSRVRLTVDHEMLNSRAPRTAT